MSNIAVVGTGYVGLCTAVTFAETGNSVVGIDTDAEKIARLTAGESPIFEPGLAELLQVHRGAGHLAFTTDYDLAIPRADFVFICVDTPTGANGGADMHHVRQAARSIARALDPGHRTIVIDKSTMPVGSGDMIATILREASRAGTPFAVVSNPEFLREGAALHDAFHPDRVVIGAGEQATAAAVAALYKPLGAPIHLTNLRAAEMIKYASNAMLATRISFMSEIAQICGGLGVDVREVATGMGLDTRIGPQFLNAGIGFGGSCFPKDVKALAFMAEEAEYAPHLLQAVLAINQEARRAFVRKISHLVGEIEGATIAVWGLAFKPGTDDLREAPSLDIIRDLLSRGATVRAFDPVAMDATRRVLPEVIYCADPYEAATDADAIALITEWDTFRALDLARVRSVTRGPIFVDGRNQFDPAAMAALGFAYHGIGVPLVPAAPLADAVTPAADPASV
jgi:UDPglucose 6-dehydrogenase